jgi:hypothetical protein
MQEMNEALKHALVVAAHAEPSHTGLKMSCKFDGIPVSPPQVGSY